MPRYSVDIPFAGYFNAIVEADSPEDAINKVLETTTGTIEFKGDGDPEIMEWDFFRDISRGNVNYVPLSHATAEIEEAE